MQNVICIFFDANGMPGPLIGAAPAALVYRMACQDGRIERQAKRLPENSAFEPFWQPL